MVFRQVLCKIQLSSGEVAVNAFNHKTEKKEYCLSFFFPLSLTFFILLLFFEKQKVMSTICLHVRVFHTQKKKRKNEGRG